jgi:hypothetical protein
MLRLLRSLPKTHPLYKCIFIALTTILLSGKALLYGAELPHVILFWLILIIYVIVPGFTLYRFVFPNEKDWLVVLGMSWAVGLALETMFFLLTKATGTSQVFFAYPLLVLPFTFKVLSTTPGDFLSESPPTPHLLVLLVLVGMVVSISLYYSPTVLFESSGEIPGDIIYHISNIAEMRNHWPMEDPHIVGAPFQYWHYFSYVSPAVVSLIAAIPVHSLVMMILPGVSSVLLLIQIYNSGRLIAGSSIVGLIACAIILFHADVGWAVSRYLRLNYSFLLRSGMGQALYESMTTQYGSIFISTLAIIFNKWFTAEYQSPVKLVILTGVLAFMTAGTKTSAMPPMLIGLAVVFALQLLIRRQIPIDTFIPLLVAGAIATPTLYFLVSGVTNVLGQDNLTVFGIARDIYPFTSPAYRSALALLEPNISRPPALLQIGRGVFLIIWSSLYPGLIGLGALLKLANNRVKLATTDYWILATYLTGLVLALVLPLGSRGDERSFLDHGLLLLGIVAASGIYNAVTNVSRKQLFALILMLIFMVPIGLYGFQRLRHGLYSDSVVLRQTFQPRQETVSDYLETMAWIRSNTSPDALLLVDHNGILASAYAERRVYYEAPAALTTLTLPDGSIRYAAQQRFNNMVFKHPTEAMFTDLVEQYGEVYFILDNLEFNGGVGSGVKINPLSIVPELPPNQMLQYSNSASQVYQLLK